MKIGLVQYNPAWEDKESNKEKIDSLLDDLIRLDLIVLPEMTLTGFTMRSSKFAEDLEGPSFHYFSSLAKDNSAHVIAGIIEKAHEGSFNTLLHISPQGRLEATYRKIHPFSYSGEDRHYCRGEANVITTIDTWKVGLSICYDLRFPELYREYGKDRAHLIVNIANWPDARIDHWRTLLKARAIENQCYVAGVNRVGEAPSLSYNGFSGLYDPMGKEIASIRNKEITIVANIDKDYVDKVRRKFPFLDDLYLI